jgi:hypothetical protein
VFLRDPVLRCDSGVRSYSGAVSMGSVWSLLEWMVGFCWDLDKSKETKIRNKIKTEKYQVKFNI